MYGCFGSLVLSLASGSESTTTACRGFLCEFFGGGHEFNQDGQCTRMDQLKESSMFFNRIRLVARQQIAHRRDQGAAVSTINQPRLVRQHQRRFRDGRTWHQIECSWTRTRIYGIVPCICVHGGLDVERNHGTARMFNRWNKDIIREKYIESRVGVT